MNKIYVCKKIRYTSSDILTIITGFVCLFFVCLFWGCTFSDTMCFQHGIWYIINCICDHWMFGRSFDNYTRSQPFQIEVISMNFKSRLHVSVTVWDINMISPYSTHCPIYCCNTRQGSSCRCVLWNMQLPSVIKTPNIRKLLVYVLLLFPKNPWKHVWESLLPHGVLPWCVWKSSSVHPDLCMHNNKQ